MTEEQVLVSKKSLALLMELADISLSNMLHLKDGEEETDSLIVRTQNAIEEAKGVLVKK